MIKKLQSKLIALSMVALFTLLSVLVISMNILNYNAIIVEADQTLSIIANNRGIFPNFEENKRPPNMSPEAPYENRYFSVLFGKNEEVLQVDTGRIKAVDSEKALSYAEEVISEKGERGFIDSYRFVCYMEGDATRVTFLDCGRKLDAFKTFLFISCGMSFVGYLLFFFVILYFSNRIIHPVTESYEKQKRFITNAGHEIKTPLTIIKADVDVLEMELGENEWLADIQAQADRLTTLTNDLVYLSRMEEANDSLQMIEFPFSDVVHETALSFKALAQTQNKVFQQKIQPFLSITGNEKAIRQLVNILLDNALKYSPDNGTIILKLENQNKAVRLSVFNTTENRIPKESINLLFERFYRIDQSRNSLTGGYGIGLSVAKAIVEAHNGRIEGETKDGHSLQITAVFPI